ncbi:S-methyl-5-thioribose-1-phosphate isomerase [Candidatus Woesearchaeota archaeon]|nr:S-methyl-5-thioribose-1-phosphate isomerase [Candidatus Woesearchaeota archaeon]
MTFEKIVKDIKNLKIQGATNVAKSAALAMNLIAREYENKDRKILLNSLHKARNILLKTRATEPAMRNVLNYMFNNLEEEDLSGEIGQRAKEITEHFKKSREKITMIGSKKIASGMVVFTHCHSSSVTNILIHAKTKGKKIQVHNTETRPMFQGRITARELARHKIPVTHFIDSAARFALKKADIMLIGADAITTEGKIINKIGSEMFAEIAEKHDIPVYACTDSWKFDPETIFGYEEEIEQRKSSEIWPNPPKNVKIQNPSFEKISPDLVAGVISELGIYKPEVFIEEVKRNYPWMF